MGCDHCGGKGGGGCSVVRPRGPNAPGAEPPPGALYIFQTNIFVAMGSGAQTVFTLPPAAAVDVFVRFHNPVTGSVTDTSQATTFSIYATNRLISYKLDENSTINITDTNDRILAIRDIAVEAFEVKADGLGLLDANGAYYDVVAIGWAKEPTGLGPIALSEWVEGLEPPPEGRSVGLPLLAIGDDGLIHTLHSTNAGALKVEVVSGSVLTPSATRATSLAYEASHTNGATAVTMRSLFVYSRAAAAGWIFLYDRTALPANGTVPDFPPIPIPAGPSFVSADFPEGRVMANGVVLAFSSTANTLTLATADCWFEAQF